jgi:hexosaminidase
MKKFISIALLFTCLIAKGQNTLNLVPMPAEVKMGKGEFIFKQPIGFIVNDDYNEGDGGTDAFQKYLKKNFGFTKFIDGDTHSYGLPSEIFISIDNKRKDDGYTIEVRKKEIVIDGSPRGIFYGYETLKQLIKKNSKNQIIIPQCKITDSSRFKYRGMHLDVARHFYPISFIKKYIDYLAAYKFNTFHWHLTDDQGWRIEIKKYPKLTQVGGYRNGTIIGRYPGKGNDSLRYGGFYTQAQIKEIVQYAADRYITVIPEIEMPGHASAAIAAYSQLSCFPNEDTQVPKGCTWSGSTKGKQVQQTWGVFEDVFAPTDYTFNFLQDVLDEVITLFPSKYIHIGGDECPKEAWKRSEFCQQLIKEKNVKDEHGLQSYFINRIEKYLNSKGKNIIGWDEILEGGLAPNATVMSWRGEAGGIEAAKQNHDVIMTPGKPVYFDHSQSKDEDSVTIGGYNSLEDVYVYEPVPKELTTEQAKYVLGAQANMWTEYMKNERKVEYMLFPRMAALSEVLWTPKEKRNWVDFQRRLPAIFERLEKQKINYSKAYYDLKATVLPTEDYNGVIFSLGDSTKPCYFMGDLLKKGSSGPSSNLIYKKTLNTTIKESGQFMWITLKDSIINLDTKPLSIRSLYFHFNKATDKKITLATQASKSYPGDGGFTLVNGVQNEKGLAKSSEFLGFNGTDLDATIDFGAAIEISKITLHTLNQNGSWIYLPKEIEVSFIPYIDTTVITRHPPIETITQKVTDENNLQIIKLPETKTCRYIRVVAKNYGVIPSGKPGAGNPSWLFVDEIEVE